MKALGRHILAELSQCNAKVLGDLEKVKEYMVEAARRANAQVREAAFHKFNPNGVSGVVVIAESHVSIHTWPEYHYAAVDIYTCGDTTNPQKACEYLAESFQAQRVHQTVIERGHESQPGWFGHTVEPSTAYGRVTPMPGLARKKKAS